MSLAFSLETSDEPPRLTDYEDHLLLIHPKRVIPFTHPDGKRVDAVLTDVLVLDGEGPPHVVWDLIVTQKVPCADAAPTTPGGHTQHAGDDPGPCRAGPRPQGPPVPGVDPRHPHPG